MNAANTTALHKLTVLKEQPPCGNTGGTAAWRGLDRPADNILKASSSDFLSEEICGHDDNTLQQ